MRAIKTLLSLGVALFCLVYAAQNVANHGEAYGAFAYVMGNLEHVVYPSSFGPAVTHPALVWFAMITVIALEFLAGLLALKGAWAMWGARAASAEAFQAAKKHVNLGAAVGMLVWFGLFQVIGGAYFQQWQTAAGEQSLRHAALFVVMLATLTLFINLVPDD